MPIKPLCHFPLLLECHKAMSPTHEHTTLPGAREVSEAIQDKLESKTIANFVIPCKVIWLMSIESGIL